MILVNPLLLANARLLEKTNLWMFVDVRILNKTVTIGAVYWPPKANIEFCIESLTGFLSELSETRNDNFYCILLGDFNSRMENMSNMKSMLDESTLHSRRQSLDSVSNRKGKILNEMMESHGFILCNGRSMSTTLGNYTCKTKQVAAPLTLLG